MGLDQDFYKIEKNKINKADIEETSIGAKYIEFDKMYELTNNFIDFHKPKYSDVAYFRKEYELSEIIEEVVEVKSCGDYVVVNKEQLNKIKQEIWNEFLKLFHKEKLDETEEIEMPRFYYISKVLETIINLFDFDNNFLLYHECG